jgi:hypothetical protein
MAVAALFAWLLTAGLGLYMFAIWLIEDDGSIDGKSYRRLRAPVVFGHAGLAVIGLVVWLISIYVHMNSLSWITLLILVLVATLGVFMFTRWIPVHRMYSGPQGLSAREAAGMAQGRPGPGGTRLYAADERLIHELEPMPPERNFPLPVVLLHGVLAVTTVTLVVIAIILPG